MSTHLAREEKPKYEKRLILFLDFLGFSEVVATTAKKPGELVKLIKAMDELKKITAEGFVLKRHTHFSDSIVVSYRIDKQAAAFQLLSAIAFGVIRMVEYGYLLRGAVTIGDLYHSRVHVVGPAMVKAYYMESKEAKYPRVIVDPSVFALARSNPSEANTPELEERHVRNLTRVDKDGWHYFDYVSWDSVVEGVGAENALYPDYLKKLGALIEAGLKHPEPNVKEKYLWLHPRYVSAIERAEGVPANSRYRDENPGWCEDIGRLPKLHQLARSAAADVKSWQAEQRKKPLGTPRQRQ